MTFQGTVSFHLTWIRQPLTSPKCVHILFSKTMSKVEIGFVMSFTDDLFSLRFTTDEILRPDSPNDYLSKYHIDVIRYHAYSEESIGHFNAWRYNIRSYIDNCEYSIYELFDADTQESADLFEVLFDYNTQDWKEKLAPESFGDDLLYFQSAEIPQTMRFSALTLAIVERIIQTLGFECAYAVLWPWDTSIPHLDKTNGRDLSDFFQLQSRHEDHWGKIGFKRIEGSSVLVRKLWLRGYSINDILV